MTRDELKAARKQLGLNQTEMAFQLRTPLRTYQDWERGARRVPGMLEVTMELLIKRDRWVMQAILEKVEREIKRCR